MINPFSLAPQLNLSVTLALDMALQTVLQRADYWIHEQLSCTRREIWVLLCIDGAKLNQRQIGEILSIHSNQIVKIVDVMESRGLVKRVRQKTNRRQYLIEMTAKGRKTLQQFIERREELVGSIFNPLNAEEARNLINACWAICGTSNTHVSLG